MDRLFKPIVFHRSLCECFSYGKGDTIPLDQSNVQGFNIDHATGRPLDDLTAIMRAQNKADMERLISKFERSEGTYLPEDMSFDDAVKYIQPNSCQLASELAELSEHYAKRDSDDERQVRYNKLRGEFERSLFKSVDDDDDDDDDGSK